MGECPHLFDSARCRISTHSLCIVRPSEVGHCAKRAEYAERRAEAWEEMAGRLVGHLEDEGHLASGSVDPKCRKCMALAAYEALKAKET